MWVHSFKKLKNILLPGCLALLLSGCPPCETIIIDNGPLQDWVLSMVPYTNGNQYNLKHSNGQVINYMAERESVKEIMECRHCCDYTFSYEINTTTLTPDYPVFSIRLELSNADTTRFEFAGSIGKYFFNIPTNHNYYSSNVLFADSALIGETYYKDVYKIMPYNNGLWSDPIAVDTVYYNYTGGILLIKMSNEEFFTIDY
jgi:hypothetical protein